jgi:hypothetical protein
MGIEGRIEGTRYKIAFSKVEMFSFVSYEKDAIHLAVTRAKITITNYRGGRSFSTNIRSNNKAV